MQRTNGVFVKVDNQNHHTKIDTHYCKTAGLVFQVSWRIPWRVSGAKGSAFSFFCQRPFQMLSVVVIADELLHLWCFEVGIKALKVGSIEDWTSCLVGEQSPNVSKSVFVQAFVWIRNEILKVKIFSASNSYLAKNQISFKS